MAIVILSYCDTEKKKRKMMELTDAVKEAHPEEKIVIYSHYMDIDPSFIEKADYYIFDKENPIIERNFTLFDWITLPNIGKRVYRKISDYGYSVLLMIKRSLAFLKGIGEERALFLNYDVIPDDIPLENIRGNKFCEWGKEGLSLCHFTIEISSCQPIIDIITEERYRNTDKIPESIWKDMVLDAYGDIEIIEGHVRMSESTTSRDVEAEKRESLGFTSLQPLMFDGKKSIAIWGCKSRIESIEIKCDDGKIYTLQNECGSNHEFFNSTDIDFSYFEIERINGKATDHRYISENLDSRYWEGNWAADI
jgi:hypothetical protein